MGTNTNILMNRRQLLATVTGSVGAAILSSQSVLAQQGPSAQKRATFVLVHGAAQGGWVWKRVRERLSERGHAVFTPTLTGLGERSHLLSDRINLSTHINDVTNVVQWEDLDGFVLVG